MPGLRGALSVRINDGQTDRIVSRHCRGLKFTKVAPGGHKALSVHVDLPRDTFNELGPEDRIYVYDARTTRTIIEGYLENPTPVDGPDGQAYDLAAAGAMALPNDETRALIYVTKGLDEWEPDPATAAYSGAALGVKSSGQRVQIPSGSVIATSGFGSIRNTILNRAGMNLGAFTVDVFGGKTDTGWKPAASTDGGYLANLGAGGSGTLSTSHLVSTKWVGTDFTSSTILYFFLQRLGLATTVADDISWAQFDAISILGQRMDRNGTLLTGSAGLVSATQVLASQVVEDLLGRLMTFCDAAAAQVDTTTFGITELSYPSGVKAAGVLNDLAVYEADFLWEVLESLDNGKHRFNYRAWPTTPRYEVSVKDGWRETGSDVDLCNRILVTYTDETGKTQTEPVTADDIGVTDPLPGRVKDADPVTLPGTGSATIAIRIGGQILADKINPPKAGTVLVRRPIADHLTGNMAMPWELETGYLCRIRETGDDLRITQADYDDDQDCSMLLTLGTPVLTDEQRLARLDRAVSTTLSER